MDRCVNHEGHVAIENCELCQIPLCSLCLRYAADGCWLCEEDAREVQERGQIIYAPAAYADALPGTLKQARQQDEDASAAYQGNSQDVSALISAVLALTELVSCCGGVYCLPIIAVILGAFAYLNAEKRPLTWRARAAWPALALALAP